MSRSTSAHSASMPLEQRAAAKPQCILELILLAQLVEAPQVRPQPVVVNQPYNLARRLEAIVGGRAQHAPQRPYRAAQASAGARVQDVGPERGCDLVTPMRPWLEREIAEQRLRRPARRGRPRAAVDLHLELSEHADSERDRGGRHAAVSTLQTCLRRSIRWSVDRRCADVVPPERADTYDGRADPGPPVGRRREAVSPAVPFQHSASVGALRPHRPSFRPCRALRSAP
jgi:hypothetical protein